MNALWAATASADQRMRLVAIGWQWFAVITATVVGCNRGPEYPHASISGNVTVDGKPVEVGTITYFSDAVEAGRVGKATIDKGAYELDDVPIGAAVFTFAASAESGRTIAGPDGVPEPERINIIPRKYVSEGIARNIEADGTQDFAIESGQ